MIRARAEAAAITKREKATGVGAAGTSVSLDEDISRKGHTQKRGKTSSASKDHEKNLGDLHHGVPEIQGAGDSVVSEEERPRVEPENYPENATKAEEEETSVEKGIDS